MHFFLKKLGLLSFFLLSLHIEREVMLNSILVMPPDKKETYFYSLHLSTWLQDIY